MLIWNDMDDVARADAIARPIDPVDGGVAARVAELFDVVAGGGDAALRELSAKYDGADLPNLLYAPTAGVAGLSDEARAAIENAARNIPTFHGAASA